MRLKFGQHILEVAKLENEEFKKSELFENELHNFSYTISVKGTLLDSFKETLEASEDGGLYSLDNENNILKEYSATSKGFSYSGNNSNGDTIYSYNLYFEEVVNVNLEALKISDLTVKPYNFEQRYDNGIIITASVKLTIDDMEKFKNIEDGDRYFNVIRHGISEKIVKMRFGRNIWSEHDDFFKVQLSLVEDCYDSDNKNQGFFGPEMSNIQDMLAYQQSLNKELINLLLAKSIVSEEEVEVAKDKAQKNLSEVYRLFYKVKDVDTF